MIFDGGVMQYPGTNTGLGEQTQTVQGNGWGMSPDGGSVIPAGTRISYTPAPQNQPAPQQQPTYTGPMYDPPTGETPIQDLAPYNGPGGSMEAARAYAAMDFKKVFGRNPSESELSQLQGAYYISDPNLLNRSAGMAGIGNYYSQQANTPANVYARQQAQWQAKAPQQYGTVNSLTQSLYGRDASQEEQSHFGTLLASGQADPYQIQQFLMATPEYQNKQDTSFRNDLNTQLQGYDENFFNRAKGGIAQQYALMGRATSPALDVALTDLAAQINDKRGQFLSQLSASQYGNNKQAAMGDYQKTQSDIWNQIYGNTNAQYGNLQGNIQRSQNLADASTQAQQFQNYANQYAPKPGVLDYLNTGANVANAAAKIYAAA